MKETSKSIATIITIYVMMAGCGAEKPVIADQPAFDQAVEAYLHAKSMDLAIAEYDEFELSDDGRGATAIISLVYSGEGWTKARTRFEFEFRKTDDKWEVVDHRHLKL